MVLKLFKSTLGVLLILLLSISCKPKDLTESETERASQNPSKSAEDICRENSNSTKVFSKYKNSLRCDCRVENPETQNNQNNSGMQHTSQVVGGKNGDAHVFHDSRTGDWISRCYYRCKCYDWYSFKNFSNLKPNNYAFTYEDGPTKKERPFRYPSCFGYFLIVNKRFKDSGVTGAEEGIDPNEIDLLRRSYSSHDIQWAMGQDKTMSQEQYGALKNCRLWQRLKSETYRPADMPQRPPGPYEGNQP